jgi:hypothetical protein
MAAAPLVIGNGPRKVMALHGWFGSATWWGPFADLVDGDRYSYAFLGYRGYGARRGEAGEHTLAEISADAPRRGRRARLVELRRAGALDGWQRDAARAPGRR